VTWQRGARFLVAGVGLATAIAIVVLLRDRDAPAERGGFAALDPGAALQTGSGVDIRTQGDQRTALVAHDGMTQFKDGRAGWKNPRFTLKDGSVLSAGYAESLGKATTADSPGAELALRDGVRFEDKTQGATLSGASATYNERTGLATIPGPVTFSRNRMAGGGTGAVHERDTGLLRVLADVKVTLQDDAGGPVEATAETMTFTSATRSMLFDRRARIARQSEVLSGDRALLFLSDDDQFFRAIELRGRARVAPAADTSTGMPDMQADDIDLAFHDGTQALRQAALNGHARMLLGAAEGSQQIEAPRIDLKTAADGRTLTDLRAGPTGVVVRLPATNAAPARTIESATLAAAGSEKGGLLTATFTDAVRFTEAVAATPGRAASTREGRSRWLMLDLDGKLNAVKKATFRQDVIFETKSPSGVTTADADVGIYDAATGRLDLTPAATKATHFPRVTDPDVTVNAAAQIIVGLNSDSLDARGRVTTLSTGESKGVSRGFFTPGERIFGSSETLRRDAGTKTLRYVGSATAPARLQQGDSLIVGREIVVNEDSGDLEATGQVQSTVMLDAGQSGRGAGRGASGRYVIHAETMAYVEQQRTATYGGAPVVLTRPDGTIRSKSLVVTLARDERRLERLVATEAMTAALEKGREAKGGQLTYDAVADRYTVRGAPVLLRTRAQDGSCTLSRGQVVHFVGSEGESEWRGPENPGGTDTAPYSCTEPLP
jgi:lipopolysaccharide export system protein LptA